MFKLVPQNMLNGPDKLPVWRRWIWRWRFSPLSSDAEWAIEREKTAGKYMWPLASTPPAMPGTHPPIFWLGNVNGNIPPPNYYVLSDIADQYWLPSVRSASSRFYSAIIKTPPIRFSQAGGQSAHEARPPTLNSRWRHWCGPRKSCSVFLQNKFVFSLVPRLPTTLPAFTAERRAAAPLLLSANVWCWLISPVCGALSNKPTARGCCCRSTGQRDARVVGLYKTRLRAVSIII